MKNRLEAKTKTANFHWVFDFNTITQHPYALPVIFCKLSVIVCIKCWALLHKNDQIPLIKRTIDEWVRYSK